MNTAQFKIGMRVRYIPPHILKLVVNAMEDPAATINNLSCYEGVVSSVNESFVFVKYDIEIFDLETGKEDCTDQTTSPENLLIL